MNHLLRLGLLSVLVFLVMTAYSFLPRVSNVEFGGALRDGYVKRKEPRFQIFIDSEEKEIADSSFNNKKAVELKKENVKKKNKIGGKKDKEVEKGEKNPGIKTRKYIIKKGDTLIKIARTLCGSKDFVQKIMDLNPGIKPTKLEIKQKIIIPEKINNPIEKKKKEPKETLKKYRVKDGDSFSSLAERFLGAGSKWRTLWNLNKNSVKDYNILSKDKLIFVPVKAN